MSNFIQKVLFPSAIRASELLAYDEDLAIQLKKLHRIRALVGNDREGYFNLPGEDTIRHSLKLKYSVQPHEQLILQWIHALKSHPSYCDFELMSFNNVVKTIDRKTFEPALMQFPRGHRGLAAHIWRRIKDTHS